MNTYMDLYDLEEKFFDVVGIIAFFVIRALSADYDDEDEEDDEDMQPTRYKCPNCGGAIVKVEEITI